MKSGETTGKHFEPGEQQSRNKHPTDGPGHELVDLGDATAETQGNAGGALDCPISNGHY